MRQYMAPAAGLEPAHRRVSTVTSSFQDYPFTVRIKPTILVPRMDFSLIQIHTVFYSVAVPTASLNSASPVILSEPNITFIDYI